MSESVRDPSQQVLKNRVALITGGARGIGFEIARAFVAHGAKVAICDNGVSRDGSGADPEVVLRASRELQEGGAEVFASHADVSDESAVGDLIGRASAKLGTIDVLVNNAGIISDRSLFDMDSETWDKVLRVHLRGSFLCTQAVARGLRAAKMGGSIINMTSTSGMLGNLGQLNESSAKAGIYGLTRTSSIELQKFRIRVNALAAIAKTRLTEDLPMFEKAGNAMTAAHIAPAALFLASELADEISGAVLSVAGGRISTFELAESQGRLKEADGGIWTPQEIADNYDSIAKK